MKLRHLTALSVATAAVALLPHGTAAAIPGDNPTAQDLTVACAIPADRDINVTRTVYQTGLEHHVSDKVMLAGFEAGWVESRMNNLNCGDADSLGVFQERPSQNWGTPAQIMDVHYAATQFFTRAIAREQQHPEYSAGQIAQAVEVSCCPEKYPAAENKARAMMAEVAPLAVPPDRVNQINRDGYADLVGVAANGELFGYHNGSLVNTDHVPFASETWRVTNSDWSDAKQIATGDVTGDGYADLVAARADGSLVVYANGIELNADGIPFIGQTWSYPGSWNTMRQLAVADVTGDGYADIVAVDASGALVVYANGLKVNGTPFTAETYHIGGNWSAVKQLALTDVNRDGYADIVAVDGNGQLFGYNNGSLVNANHVPFAGETWRITGSNWSGVTQLTAGEFSGDGYGDLVAVEADGSLSVYANNILNTPTMPYAARTWHIGGDWSTVKTLA
jgi:hypothetical protein